MGAGPPPSGGGDSLERGAEERLCDENVSGLPLFDLMRSLPSRRGSDVCLKGYD